MTRDDPEGERYRRDAQESQSHKRDTHHGRVTQDATSVRGSACCLHIAVFEFSYNSAKHATTGVEPFFIQYGDLPPAPLQMLKQHKVRSKLATELADL